MKIALWTPSSSIVRSISRWRLAMSLSFWHSMTQARHAYYMLVSMPNGSHSRASAGFSHRVYDCNTFTLTVPRAKSSSLSGYGRRRRHSWVITAGQYRRYGKSVTSAGTLQSSIPSSPRNVVLTHEVGTGHRPVLVHIPNTTQPSSNILVLQTARTSVWTRGGRIHPPSDTNALWLEFMAGETGGGDREGPSPPGPINSSSWVGPGGPNI